MKQISMLIVLAVLLAACKKGDNAPLNPIDQLPATTHNGANTLGCLVDGKAFVVSGKSYMGHPTGLTFYAFANTAWWVSGQLGYQHLSMNFDYNKNPSVPGTFEMADNYPAGAEFLNPSSDNTAITGSNDFKTDAVHKGTLTLQYYDGKIAAGTFSFDCANDSGQVIHITDGRFDITL